MAETLICSLRRVFATDLKDRCAVCKRPVFFRPYNLMIDRRVCQACGLRELEATGEKPELTKGSREELKDLGYL